MMISDLPSDLLEEILSRVPATTWLRSTCKQWESLFKNQRFAKKHFRRAPKQSMVLMLKKRRVCPMRVNLNVSPPSIEYKAELGLVDSYSNAPQVDISKIFHCDGLLVCTTRDLRFVVWNPCLGKTNWFQPMTGYKWPRFALGYVNNKSCRRYKILSYSNGIGIPIRRDEFGIYEFSTDTWKVLDVDANNFDTIVEGVSLKGNAYWCVLDKTNNSYLVLCFDFTSERFRRLSFPTFQNRGCDNLSVIREEQLSILHRCFVASKMELWVTNEIDTEAELSWSKSFAVDLEIGLPWSMSYLINEEKKVFVCCINFNGEISKNTLYIFEDDGKCNSRITFGESTNSGHWLPHIYNYVPSFVQIQQ